jgi:hypothetical protein
MFEQGFRTYCEVCNGQRPGIVLPEATLHVIFRASCLSESDRPSFLYSQKLAVLTTVYKSTPFPF